MQYQTKQSVQKIKKNTLCIVSSKLAQIHTHNKNEAQSLETIFHSSFELHDCYTLQNPRLRYSGNAGSHLLLRH